MTWVVPVEFSVRLPGLGFASPRANPAADAPPAPVVVEDAEVSAALAEYEAGRRRPYYDAAQDGPQAAAYFAAIDPAAKPKPLFEALAKLTKATHKSQPGYKPSKYVYPVVDVQPDGRLRSIYTDDTYGAAAFIREAVAMERAFEAEVVRLAAAEGLSEADAFESALEAAAPFNCEHVVPQSWFRKAEPMRGDLHHLFTCESTCNSFRGNRAYRDFLAFEPEATRQACGRTEENRWFEPWHGKGPVARATLYFLVRYRGEINAAEIHPEWLETVKAWHAADPVTEYERHRNAEIFAKQGNRNPFIDHPEWVAKVDFAAGIGA